MEPRVSVIVPIWNEERHLAGALGGILSQDFEALEAVLVDGGSEDGSLALARQYAEKYPGKVRVFTVPPGEGPGTARQEGIRQAKGDYLVFADADDLLPEKDVVSRLYRTIRREEADIVVGNYDRLLDGRRVPARPHGFTADTDPTTEDFRFQGFFSGGHLAYVWGKMYRKGFLEEHQITFSGLPYGEDKLFNFFCYAARPSYVFVPETVYTYVRNRQSISFRYHGGYRRVWKAAVRSFHRGIRPEDRRRLSGLVVYTLLFSAFFDARQAYERDGGRERMEAVLEEYRRDRLCIECFRRAAAGRYVKGIRSPLWRTGLIFFSDLMAKGRVRAAAAAIRTVLDVRLDKGLSSTPGRGRWSGHGCPVGRGPWLPDGEPDR